MINTRFVMLFVFLALLSCTSKHAKNLNDLEVPPHYNLPDEIKN